MHDPQPLALFFEGWALFREPVLAGAIAGALLGMLGVYVVLRRVVFLSAAISQAAGLGVALALYGKLHLGLVGWMASPTIGAAVVTGIAVLPFVGVGTGAKRDSLLGVIWLLGAGGTLVVATRIASELSDIQDLLFGTAVAVVPEDFTLLWQAALGIALLHIWWQRGFAAASFARDSARVRQVPTRLLDAVLFASIALAISICTRILGALPTFAFTILPALAALAIARHLRMALMLATVIGAAMGFGGYLLSFRYSLPVGAAQTLVGVALVGVCYLPAGVRWVLVRRRGATARAR